MSRSEISPLKCFSSVDTTRAPTLAARRRCVARSIVASGAMVSTADPLPARIFATFTAGTPPLTCGHGVICSPNDANLARLPQERFSAVGDGPIGGDVFGGRGKAAARGLRPLDRLLRNGLLGGLLHRLSRGSRVPRPRGSSLDEVLGEFLACLRRQPTT